MRSAPALLRHPFAGPVIRYGIAGAIVACVYLGVPPLLNGVLGTPIEAAIPVAYLLAITLHFNLQRHFVFRHVEEFALPIRRQIGRYAIIAAVQYPSTALATVFLSALLGISERVVYLVFSVCIAIAIFLVLRARVFHPTVQEEIVLESLAAQRSADGSARSPGQLAERNVQRSDPVRS